MVVNEGEKTKKVVKSGNTRTSSSKPNNQVVTFRIKTFALGSIKLKPNSSLRSNSNKFNLYGSFYDQDADLRKVGRTARGGQMQQNRLLSRVNHYRKTNHIVMDFGKLPFVDHVAFHLPAEPRQNVPLLEQLADCALPNLYIGPTGYNMKPWVSKWYPPGARDKDFLRHYGAQFNTIEFNTTHYRIPDSATVQRWYDDTPADFRFCPKIPQSISHARDLGLSNQETRIFCESIAVLEEKLGCCFMQLPPGFGPRDLAVLQLFLEKFPQEIPLAVEVRHPLFFKPGPEAEQYFDLLASSNIGAVITDVAGRRDVCHMRLTSDKTLIRFVGNGLHPSDYTRVQEWSERLKYWFDHGLHAAYCFTHEPDNLLAPELAEFCAATFAAAMPQVALRGPKPVPGQQGTLF